MPQSLRTRLRLTEGTQKAYEELRRTQTVVVQQETAPRPWARWRAVSRTDVNNALSSRGRLFRVAAQTWAADLPESGRNYLRIIRQSGEDISHIVARMREFYRRRFRHGTNWSR